MVLARGQRVLVEVVADDPSVDHVQHPVRDPADRCIVGDDDDGPAVLVTRLPQQCEYLVAGRLVECTGGFVGQQHGRLLRQGPRNRDTLLLPAAQLTREAIDLANESDLGERRRAAFAVRTGERGDQLHVLDGGERRDQVEELKDEAHSLTPERAEGFAVELSDGDAVHLDDPARRTIETADDVQECGLARATRAQQNDELTGPDLEIDPVEGTNFGHTAAVYPVDTAERDRRLRRASSGFGHTHPLECRARYSPGPGPLVPLASRQEPAMPRPTLSTETAPPSWSARRSVAALIGIVGAVVVAASAFGGSSPTQLPDPQDRRRLELELPPALLAAERFSAAPSAATARELLRTLGGVDQVVVARATGSFDLVTFDPADPNHLLASHRSSYGAADNSARNEEWVVDGSAVRQELFAEDRPHDVVQFSATGDVVVWTNPGGADFGPRVVEVLGGSGPRAPVYAARAVVVDETLFALTAPADYYDRALLYDELVAMRGAEVTRLDDGSGWSRLDEPMPGVVVAYPAGLGATSVWDADSLARLADHPLSGLPYTALAVSADGTTGVGVTTRGDLETFDPVAGVRLAPFGELNPEAVVRPIALSPDGSVTVTVDRSGHVTLWWTGEEQPIMRVAAAAGPSRVMPEFRAPFTTSTVEPNARHIALKRPAVRDRAAEWTIINTDLDAWVEQACALAARVLTDSERTILGLTRRYQACH